MYSSDLMLFSAAMDSVCLCLYCHFFQEVFIQDLLDGRQDYHAYVRTGLGNLSSSRHLIISKAVSDLKFISRVSVFLHIPSELPS